MVSRIAVLLPLIVFAFSSVVYAQEQPAAELKAEVVNCASVEKPAVEIIVKEYTFDPPEAKVPAGSVIKWTNKGSLSHMITSGGPASNPGKVFSTGFVGVNGSICVKFVNPGSYDYFCRPHGNLMKDGKVVVE